MWSLSHGSWVLSLLAILLLCASGVRADDLDALRTEWRDFMTGGTNANLSDSFISSRVASIGSTANSTWTSLDKSATRTYLWGDAASTNISAHITTCYSRIKSMALGWATRGSALYGNASLGSDTVAAMDWMYANRYSEAKTKYDNWWDWEIGAPMSLNDAMTLIYDQLTGTQITNYCKAIDKFSPAVTMTGANRVWKADVVGVRGAVGRDATKVAAARDGLSGVFPYVTTSDGFYTDGSFIQHGKHPYTAGYGISLFRDISKLLVWLDGSPWAVTDAQRTNVVRWAYDSFEPMIYRGALPEHLRGREMSRNYTGFSVGHTAINAILLTAQTAPAADAARLKSMVKYWAQTDTTASLPSYVDIGLVTVAEQLLTNSAVTPRAELIGHYRFPCMDRVMHLRPGFGFGLSCYSSRTYNYESINSENWHGWFTSQGMTYLWNSDLAQFTDYFWPTVDPFHLPGTTVDLTTLANGAGQSKASSQSWVGGADLAGSFGVAGMALSDAGAWAGTLVANKSWFMFDDEIVCLGAGITCGSATNVHTTVENRRLNSAGNNAFTANGAAMPTTLGWASNFTGASWCALDTAGGYFFPGGANLSARREARSGKWSDINAGGSTSSGTRNYLTLWFDHGVKPTNSTYAYVLLPNQTAAQVATYAAQPEIAILTNTPLVQAVRETSLGILAANFWTDAPATADFITVNRKASVITRTNSTTLEVAVADPTHTNTSAIVVTLNRAASGVVSADAAVSVLQLTPQVRISVNVSGARGQARRALFSLVANPVAVDDLAATGAGTPILIDALANDLPGVPPLVITAITQPTNGTATLTNQRIAYVSRPGFAGTDTFKYFISDGTRSATGQVSVAVGEASLTLYPAQVSASTDDGNVPANTIDGDFTTRWSALGDPQWIQYDLLSTQRVDAVSLAFYSGAARVSFFDLLLSSDGTNWTTAFAGQSSGTTTNLQRFDLANQWARFVRVVGHSNSVSGWNSIAEARIHAVANAAPIAAPDAAATMIGTPVEIAVLANDSDPDAGPQALGVTSVSAPTYGTATLMAGAVRYQPGWGYAGVDGFSYVISDSGLTATGLVTVTVTNLILPPPVLAPVPDQSLVAGAVLSVTNQAYDPGTPPQRLVFSLASAPMGAGINATSGVITWRPGMAQADTSNRFTVVVTQAGWQTNLAPLADAYVRDGTYSNANYGLETNLVVKLGGTGLNRESYLRFDVAGLPGGFVAAVLKLIPTLASLPEIHAVAVVPDNAWGETTLTWSNKPSSSAPLATWTPQAGVPVEANVSSAVQNALPGSGLLSLRVFATNSTGDGYVSYASRETGPATTPRLIVSTANGGGLSATQSFWVHVRLPQPPVLSASVATNGQFSLRVTGDAGPDYAILISSNLLDWVAVFTNSAPEVPFLWTDSEAAWPARFYQVRLGP